MGAGLVLDILVEYLFRVIVRFFKRWNTRSWKIVTAKITSATYRGGFGCTVSDITYRYSIEGARYTGKNSVPFVNDRGAKDYIEHYSPGSEIVIRVKPGEPETSVVREADLYRAEHGFRLESQ